MENIEKLLSAIIGDYARFCNDEKKAKEFYKNLELKRTRKYYIVVSAGKAWGFIQRYNDAKFRAGDILKAQDRSKPDRRFACGNVILKQFDNVSWNGA